MNDEQKRRKLHEYRQAVARTLHKHMRMVEPATPEEEHEFQTSRQVRWDGLIDDIMHTVIEAFGEVPPISVEGASARTALLERALREMTEKLIEYPSTPYTMDSTMNINQTLAALERSIRIDRLQAGEIPPRQGEPRDPRIDRKIDPSIDVPDFDEHDAPDVFHREDGSTR